MIKIVVDTRSTLRHLEKQQADGACTEDGDAVGYVELRQVHSM